MRYELTDHEWTAIRPMLPYKPRGVPRVNNRRILNLVSSPRRLGAFWPQDIGEMRRTSHRNRRACQLPSNAANLTLPDVNSATLSTPPLG